LGWGQGSISKELNWLTNELDHNPKKFGSDRPEEHFAMFVLFAKCNTGTPSQETHVNKPTASVISLDDNHIQENGKKDLLISFMRALGMQKTHVLDNGGNVQFSDKTKKAIMCHHLHLLSLDVPDAIQEGPVKSTTKMPFGGDFLSAQQQKAIEDGDLTDDMAEENVKEEKEGCDAHSCNWCSSKAETKCEDKSGCTWESSSWFGIVPLAGLITGAGTCKANQ